MIRITGHVLKDGRLVKKKRAKYGAKRMTLDGYKFDSRAEGNRYAQLRQQEQMGAITDLKIHPLYPLEVHGVHIASYEADFSYRVAGTNSAKSLVIEDVKAVRTPEFKIKWKLAQVLYPGAEFRMFDVLDGKHGRWTQEDVDALATRVAAAGYQ